MIRLRSLFITAIAGLVMLFPGCAKAPATHQNASAVQPTVPGYEGASTPPAVLNKKVSIISDPPGARIEINNDYVGDAPLEVEIPSVNGQFGMVYTTIRSTPRAYHIFEETYYAQSKYFGPFEAVPSRVLFQMNVPPPVTNQ
jgi:hypothetical protein